MYVNLTSNMTNRLIDELKNFWISHPQYPSLVNNIQGKYSFQERPQEGIIVKPGGSSHTRLSADNYLGTVVSYLIHYKLQNYPGNSIEWVLENGKAIAANGGVFPSPPGIYYVEVTKTPGQIPEFGTFDYGEFYVDPLIDIVDELVSLLSPTEGIITNGSLIEGSLRLYNMPFGTMLYEGTNYTIDYDTAEITFLQPIPNGTFVTADYRLPLARTGPHYFRVDRSNVEAIPGAILSFGRRAFEGDRFAVIVQNPRAVAALEFGGRWQTSFDLDIWARDIHSQRELVDMTALYLEGVLRLRLADEGILIQEVSLGGESENIYDDNADDYFYNGSISLSIETEWFMWSPLARVIRSASPFSVAEAKRLSSLSEEELKDFTTNLQVVESIGLQSFEDPYYLGNKRLRYPIIR